MRDVPLSGLDGADTLVLGGAGSDNIIASGRVQVRGGTGDDRFKASITKGSNGVRLNGGQDVT